MVGHGGSSAGSYLADPASPIPSHCASIFVTSTLRVILCLKTGACICFCTEKYVSTCHQFFRISGHLLLSSVIIRKTDVCFQYSPYVCHCRKLCFCRILYDSSCHSWFWKKTLEMGDPLCFAMSISYVCLFFKQDAEVEKYGWGIWVTVSKCTDMFLEPSKLWYLQMYKFVVYTDILYEQYKTNQPNKQKEPLCYSVADAALTLTVLGVTIDAQWEGMGV